MSRRLLAAWWLVSFSASADGYDDRNEIIRLVTTDGGVKDFERLLGSSDAEAAADACVALNANGVVVPPEVYERLAKAPLPTVVRCLLFAPTRIQLLSASARAGDEGSRYDSAVALAQFVDDAEAAPAIIDVLDREKALHIPSALVSRLVGWTRPAVLAAVQRWMKRAEPWAAPAGIDVLVAVAEVQPTAWRAAVAALARFPDHLDALALSPGSPPRPLLRGHLERVLPSLKDEWAQHKAARALSTHRDRRSLPALKHALKTCVGFGCTGVIEALAAFDRQDTRALLHQASAHRDEYARRSAALLAELDSQRSPSDWVRSGTHPLADGGVDFDFMMKRDELLLLASQREETLSTDDLYAVIQLVETERITLPWDILIKRYLARTPATEQLLTLWSRLFRDDLLRVVLARPSATTCRFLRGLAVSPKTFEFRALEDVLPLVRAQARGDCLVKP